MEDMNLSKKWLNEFVSIDASPRDFSEALTMSGSKVEGYEIEGAELSNIVVGRVDSLEKHPDSDHLWICKINVGKETPLQIVTGAQNLKEGDKVPVALDNSVVAGGKKIKKGKLRGVLSEGMLCSLGELGLTSADFPYAIEDGIFVIEEECELGQDIHSAIGLDDTVFEFEITSNRADCFSVIGLAREAAVTYGKKANIPAPVVKGNSGDINDHLKVTVEAPDLCSCYIARMVKNVKIAPSPRFIRERLRAHGIRPINNIVDITNYVMLEYGQPMHSFDYRNLKGHEIRVRRAAAGETITTLDDVERNLTPNMLVISDESSPVAVAGVMGGEFSGIADDTTDIVFESACFSGPSVRTTARDIGLRTDSSSRFEKGLDPENCLPAIERACELVELLGAGEVVGGKIICRTEPKARTRIPFDADWINRFLGTDIPPQRMREILASLDFAFEGDTLVVPTYRADVEHKADVAEEVARIYGYNNIPSTKIRGSAEASLTLPQKFERRTGDVLVACGLYEISTYSFFSPKAYDRIGLPADSPRRRSITIRNPLGEDTSLMRTTALPSMLDALARNYNSRNEKAPLFEIATVYLPQEEDKLPLEKKKVMLGMYGEGYDFFRLKGMVETLLRELSVEDAEFARQEDDPSFHPGRCAALLLGGEKAGILGEIHPDIRENYGIGARVYAAELDFEALLRHAVTEKSYHPLPKYPAVTRDLALVCDAEMPVAELQKAIQNASGKLVKEIKLFDVYTGSSVPEGKKSVAYSIVLRSDEKTLTDEECDNAVKKIMRALEGIGVTLRA